MSYELPNTWSLKDHQVHIDTFRDFDWKDSTIQDWVRFAGAGPVPEPGLATYEAVVMAEALELYGRQPITILELGKCYGHSTRLFLGKTLRDGGELHSCELKVREHFRGKMIDLGYWQHIHLHEQLSQTIEWQGPLDFLFIDTEHAYEDAMGEFKHFYPHLTGLKLVAFHDTEMAPGVIRAVDELIAEHNMELVMASTNKSSAGLKIFKLN